MSAGRAQHPDGAVRHTILRTGIGALAAGVAALQTESCRRRAALPARLAFQERNVSTTRRDFLQITAAATGAAALRAAVPQELAAAIGPRVARADRALRILILGGTGFTGPFQVHYAVQRGHHVTVLNRGRRQVDLPPGVEHLVGDRNTPQGMDAVKAAVAGGAKWDVVIDNPTTLPFWVRDAGEALRDATRHYIFISTISVYADTSRRGMDETTPVAEYPDADPLAETMQSFQQRMGQLYGPLKAASEREAERWFPGRTTVIRPGLIVGPGDLSGRFTYWPVRIAKGGDILAPGTGHDAVQYIDARDLAEWTIRVAENRVVGTFNATGPAGELTMAEMLGGIRGALPGSTPARLVWAPADFMASQQIAAWSDMPVWVTPTPDSDGFSRVSIQRALDAGLTFRPLADTTHATLEWYRSAPQQAWYQQMGEAQRARLGGPFTAEREAAALKALSERTASG
jgi:2'-hydroxyisoflavone reductase